jgi:hypothetical protein
LCGVSGLAFAIGVYLPLATMAALFVGGCVRGIVEWRRAGSAPREVDSGILAASGLVAGEGIAGVVVAGLVAGQVAPKTGTVLLGEWAALAALLALCGFLFHAGMREGTPTEPAPATR